MNLRQYDFIHKRRDGSKLYKSTNGFHFLKIGSKKAICHEKELYTMLQDYNIPTPEILSVEQQQDNRILKEGSLGDKNFKQLIEEEKNDQGFIPEKLFNHIIQVAKNIIEKKKNIDINKITTQNTNYPFEELQKEAVLDSTFINKIEEKIHHDLTNVPKIRCHGDFTVFNLFPNGVIDLEDSQINYSGYDAFALLTHLYWFPQFISTAERRRTYTFTPDQIKNGLRTLSCNNDLLNQDIFAALFLYRGARSVQRMNKTPVLRNFRYNLYKKIGDLYLGGKNVQKHILDTFNLY